MLVTEQLRPAENSLVARLFSYRFVEYDWSAQLPKCWRKVPATRRQGWELLWQWHSVLLTEREYSKQVTLDEDDLRTCAIYAVP